MTWRLDLCSFRISCQSGIGRRASASDGGGNSWASSVSSSTPSGNGQPIPAASARARYSQTVERPAPTLAAISRTERPAARSRRTSVIFLMGSLFLGTCLLHWQRGQPPVEGGTCPSGWMLRWWPEAQPHPLERSGRPLSRPESSGPAVRFRPDWVSGFPRNQCPLSAGTRS